MPKSEQLAIKVSDVSKHFKLPHDQQSSIKGKLINFRKRGYEKQEVLKNISFEVKQGEFFGIVGRNGSGKSTLLKILAGIYRPDSGNVQINGKLIPFIELGVGFNHELSGRDNVFLNGALLGFSRIEMEAMYDDIVEFAELERFMDQKLKNYSSGMQVRLAFSIAIRAQGDVLVLDEVLAVGDEAFQRKCNVFFEQIKKDKTKTVILVTHSMESVREYCNKAIMIDDGAIVSSGEPKRVADDYLMRNLMNRKSTDNREKKSWIKAEFINSAILSNKDILKLNIAYRHTDPQPVFVKVVIQHNGANVMITNAKIHQKIITQDTKEHQLEYSLNLKDFNWGECQVVLLLVDSEKNINVADYGYSGELTFKLPQTTKVAGIMKSTGELKSIR